MMNKLTALLFVMLLMLIGISILMFQAGKIHAKAEIMHRYDKEIETVGDTDVRTKCYIFEGDSTHTNCYYH